MPGGKAPKKAVSKAQQRLFGADLQRAREGKATRTGMSREDLEAKAATRRTGLPARKAAGIAADAPPPTPAEVAQIVQDVASKGDPARGEAIFRRQDLNCMKCHSVSRAGGQVGPELSAVGGSSPIDYVVNSILNPNLAVKEQYVTRVFVLSNGKVLTGVVIDRDEIRIAAEAGARYPGADPDLHALVHSAPHV